MTTMIRVPILEADYGLAASRTFPRRRQNLFIEFA